MSRLLMIAFLLMLPLPVLALEGDAGDYLRRGDSALAATDYRRALKYFTEATRLMPNSAEAWRGVGLSRLKLGANEAMTDPGMLSDAAAAFTTALLLKPDYAEVRYQLGLTWLALGSRDKAEEECRELRKLEQTLADRLQAAIDAYRATPSYRELGTKGGTDDNPTRVDIRGNSVVVPAVISYRGKETQARLLLDTGATSTVISPGIAARLGVKPEQAGKGMAQVVGGEILQTGLIQLDSVTVGPRTRTGLVVHVIPHAGPPVPFDGLLGMDFLRGLTYRVDFTRGLITWGE